MSSSSDSDDGEELATFDDGLGDDLIGDDKDRMKLNQMTEKEREVELYNRMEKREAMKIRLQVEQRLQAEKKKHNKHNKKDDKNKQGGGSSGGGRKASVDSGDSDADADGDVDDDDMYSNPIASRKSERKRGATDNKKILLNELKQKRIEKKEKDKIEHNQKELLTTKDVYSDDDDDNNDSDDNKDDSDKSSSEDGSDEEDEKEDLRTVECKEELEEIRLSRHKLEQCVYCSVVVLND